MRHNGVTYMLIMIIAAQSRYIIRCAPECHSVINRPPVSSQRHKTVKSAPSQTHGLLKSFLAGCKLQPTLCVIYCELSKKTQHLMPRSLSALKLI